MTQPEGDRCGRVREECCALKKKAVIKNLEFPVAFEPTPEGIMAAASGLHVVPKRRFWPKTNIPKWILFGSQNSIANHPKLFTTHTDMKSSTQQRFCAEYPSVPTPITSNSCLTPPTPHKTKSFCFLPGKQHLQAPEHRIRNKS